MPAQSRLGDRSQVPLDSHGCISCPHPDDVGPAICGSPNVNINSRPALRVGDTGVHAACCGSNTWTARAGSATVFINGLPAHRQGDADQHCGGMGKMIEGSPNVFCDDTEAPGAIVFAQPRADGYRVPPPPITVQLPASGGVAVGASGGGGAGKGDKTGDKTGPAPAGVPGLPTTGGTGKDGGPIYTYDCPFLKNSTHGVYIEGVTPPVTNQRAWHAGHLAKDITWAQLAAMVQAMLVGPDTRGG